MNLTDDNHITNFRRDIPWHAHPLLFRACLPLLVGATLATTIFLTVASVLPPTMSSAAPSSIRLRCWLWSPCRFMRTCSCSINTPPFINGRLPRQCLHTLLFPLRCFPSALLSFCASTGIGAPARAGGLPSDLRLRASCLQSAVCGPRSFRAPFALPYLIGKIDPDRYHMWDDISRNTQFSDVVFSPVLQAPPIGVAVGVSNKVVYPATNFVQVDQRVANVCGTFNVVIALPPGTDAGEFASRVPSKVTETRNIRLLRFANYAGKAVGCR